MTGRFNLRRKSRHSRSGAAAQEERHSRSRGGSRGSRSAFSASHSPTAASQSNPLDPAPPLTSTRYGGSFKHSLTSSSSPPSLHSAPSPAAARPRSRGNAVVPLHAVEAPNEPRFKTVTIPRGLKPHEVPLPLHAEEVWGAAPSASTATQRSEGLFQRWMDAHRYGTLAPIYSMLRPAYKSGGGGGDVQRLRPSRQSGSRNGFGQLPLSTSNSAGTTSVTSYDVDVKRSNVSASEAASLLDMDDLSEGDAWMDGAGYLHLNSFLVSGPAPPAVEPQAPPRLRGVCASAQARPVSRLRRTPSPPASPVDCRLLDSPPLPNVCATERLQREYCVDGVLARPPTTSPGTSPVDALTPQEPYLLHPQPSDVDFASRGYQGAYSAAAARRLPSMTDGFARNDDEDDLEANYSRHFVSVTALPESADDDAGLGDMDGAWLAGVDSDRDMSRASLSTPSEIAEATAVAASEAAVDPSATADMRYPGWSNDCNGTPVLFSSVRADVVSPDEPRQDILEVTQLEETAEHCVPPLPPPSAARQPSPPPPPPPPPPPQQRAPPATTELSLSAAPPAPPPLFGSYASRPARGAPSVSFVFSPNQSRFHGGGRSAAALAAERLLTLLVLAPSASKVVVRPTGGNGAQVSLPIVRAGGSTAKGLCRVVVDEAVTKASTEPYVDALLLREIAEEMRDGHCTALLLSVAGGCGGLGGRTIETTLNMVLAAVSQRQAEALQQQQRQQQRHPPARAAADGSGGVAEEEEDYYFKMEVSVALVQRGRSTKDLIVNRDEELGAMAPTRPVANPLVGSWCDNVMFQSVRSGSQIKSLLQPVMAWLEKTPESADQADETLGIYVALRQANHLTRPAGERTLTLSSLLIYVGRSPDAAVGLVQDRESGSPLQRSLLRRIGDGCFTVAASCVSDRSGSSDAYASLCAEAKALPNSGLVSGNVGRYIEALRTALAREEAGADDGARAQQRQCLRVDLLNRMEALMQDPWSETIPFYPDRVASHEEAAEKAARARAQAAAAATAAQDDSMLSLSSSAQSFPSSKYSFRVPTAEEALAMFNDCRIHTVAIRDSKKNCGYELMEGTSNGLVHAADCKTYFVDEVKPRRVLPPLHTQPIASNTTALCSLFATGHNTAVLSFDGRSDNVFSSPVWYVLAEAIDKVLGRTDGAVGHLRIAFSLIRTNGEALDLLEPGAKMQPLQVATSPVFGTTVHNACMRTLTSPDALRPMLHEVAQAATPQWTSDTFMYVSLINFFAADGDVCVSSFGITVTGSHGSACRRILATGASNAATGAASAGGVDADGLPLHPEVVRLHHGALTGSAATVFLTSLNNEEDADVAMEMASVAVPLIKKAPVRSGSVREFVRRTRKGLERRRQKARSASDEEWRHLSRMESRITEMLDDYTALLEPDATMPLPKSYVNDVVVPPYPREIVAAPAAASDGSPATPATGAPPSSASLPLSRTVSIALPADRYKRTAPAPGAPEPQAFPALPPPPPAPVPRARPTAPAARAPVAATAAVFAPRAAAPASVDASARDVSVGGSSAATLSRPPEQHPQWVVGVEQHGKAAKAMHVARFGREMTWKSTLEHFETDDVVVYAAGQPEMKLLFTEDCAEVQSLLEKSRAGQSCAMLGLMDDQDKAASASVHVRAQPLWRSYTAVLLNSCFHAEGDAAWLHGSELHLRLCAVQDRTLRYDFLQETTASASSAPLAARVSLAASPLFGPVVRNTTVMRATNLQECQFILRSGLHALNELHNAYDSGTIVIASAVLKNVTRDDIIISSLTAIAARIGKDMPAVRDILAMDSRGGAPPALYHYALRGPCHLLCLTTLRSASDSQCVEALRLGQSVRYGASAPVPSGSLSTCIREQEALLQQRRASSGPATEQARVVTANVVQELTRMQRDPTCSIVIFPLHDDGVPCLLPETSATFGPAQQRTLTASPSGSVATSGSAVFNGVVNGCVTGGGGQCRCTAVITAAPRGRASALEARIEGHTVRSGHTTYPFTEVVLRADSSSLLRPGLLHSIAEHVQQGRNSTLVAVDGPDSCAGPALLSKLVSLLIQNNDVGRVRKTLFMSVTAARYPLRTSPGADAEAQVKDLFDADGEFYPLRAARSPFFGSCVDGARFSSLSRIGDVYLTLKDAQRACSFIKATLNVVIVLKQVLLAADGVTVDDVVMSSVFAVLNCAGNGQGPHACSVFDAMLDRRAASLGGSGGAGSPPAAAAATSPSHKAAAGSWRRCLLAQALGGDSFTYGVVGLTADTRAEEAAVLLRFGMRLMQVPCRPPARSSAREVLQRAEARLHQHPAPSPDASTDLSGMAWDWQQVKAEAERVLRDPDACKPHAFLCE